MTFRIRYKNQDRKKVLCKKGAKNFSHKNFQLIKIFLFFEAQQIHQHQQRSTLGDLPHAHIFCSKNFPLEYLTQKKKKRLNLFILSSRTFLNLWVFVVARLRMCFSENVKNVEFLFWWLNFIFMCILLCWGTVRCFAPHSNFLGRCFAQNIRFWFFSYFFESIKFVEARKTEREIIVGFSWETFCIFLYLSFCKFLQENYWQL